MNLCFLQDLKSTSKTQAMDGVLNMMGNRTDLITYMISKIELNNI